MVNGVPFDGCNELTARNPSEVGFEAAIAFRGQTAGIGPLVIVKNSALPAGHSRVAIARECRREIRRIRKQLCTLHDCLSKEMRLTRVSMS